MQIRAIDVDYFTIYPSHRVLTRLIADPARNLTLYSPNDRYEDEKKLREIYFKNLENFQYLNNAIQILIMKKKSK